MPRNFVRRVEIMFPIEDEGLRARLIDEVLATMLADSAKAWRLGADGAYQRVPAGAQPLRSQLRFVELARERAHQAEAARAPGPGYRARAAHKARGPAADAVWSLASPGAPTGNDLLAS